MDKKIKVAIWNEFIHEREENPLGDYLRTICPDGIHRHLARELAAGDCKSPPPSCRTRHRGCRRNGWAAPTGFAPERVPSSPEAVEPIRSVNPLGGLDTSFLLQ